METNSIVKSLMIEKILKIDFQNFYISWETLLFHEMSQKVNIMNISR